MIDNQFKDSFDKIFSDVKPFPKLKKQKDATPLGEYKKPKDRVDLGLSPSCIVEEIDCTRGKK